VYNDFSIGIAQDALSHAEVYTPERHFYAYFAPPCDALQTETPFTRSPPSRARCCRAATYINTLPGKKFPVSCRIRDETPTDN
jgi:hypothetical protein